MKGIILAGGSGTRLYPVTKAISKQLMPIYDKPMVYYPLSVLMIANIKEICIISTPEDLPRYKQLLGNGSNIGMKFSFIEQPSPDGLAQAFILGKDFIGSDDVCLILGDNIYYGHGMTDLLSSAVLNAKNKNMSTVFSYHVNNPEQYGVIEFDNKGKVLSIEEKPEKPKSNFALTGLYFFQMMLFIKLKMSCLQKEGELEITTLMEMYLNEKRLVVELMGRGYAWLDTGTHKNFLEASTFIEIIERRQGLKVACIEEIAFKKGYITKTQLLDLAKPLANNQYGQYLLRCVQEFNKKEY